MQYVIYLDWQLYQIFNSLTIRTELDFKSENLLRMCSVVTNLVTSIEFQPILCATTPFHFGRTRNDYVATRISLLSSTAESSTTSVYVVATERSGQKEAGAGRNVERARKEPSSFPTGDLIDAARKHEPYKYLEPSFSKLWIVFHCFQVFSSYGNFLDFFVYVFIYCVGAGITNLMFISDGSDPYFFRQKMEKTRSEREEKNGRVFFSRQSRHVFLLK